MERAALTRLPSSSTVTGRRAVPRSARPAGLNDVPRYGEAAICLLLVAAGQSQTTCPTTATHERSAPKLNYVTARSERLRARGQPSVSANIEGCARRNRAVAGAITPLPFGVSGRKIWSMTSTRVLR